MPFWRPRRGFGCERNPSEFVPLGYSAWPWQIRAAMCGPPQILGEKKNPTSISRLIAPGPMGNKYGICKRDQNSVIRWQLLRHTVENRVTQISYWLEGCPVGTRKSGTNKELTVIASSPREGDPLYYKPFWSSRRLIKLNEVEWNYLITRKDTRKVVSIPSFSTFGPSETEWRAFENPKNKRL